MFVWYCNTQETEEDQATGEEHEDKVETSLELPATNPDDLFKVEDDEDDDELFSGGKTTNKKDAPLFDDDEDDDGRDSQGSADGTYDVSAAGEDLVGEAPTESGKG